MKTSVDENGIVTIRVRGNEFKFKEGSCDNCPLGEEKCTKMRDPRNPEDEHLDFMDFCQTLDIDNLRPFLGEEKYSIDENKFVVVTTESGCNIKFKDVLEAVTDGYFACDLCPIKGRCSSTPYPGEKEATDKHNFLEFCMYHVGEDNKPFKKFCEENGIYANTLIPVEKPY